MYYIIYKITNLINGKIYIGKHKTKKIDDGYMGSGKYIKVAILKYGITNFSKDILSYHETEESMNLTESLLVNQEFVDRNDTYNLVIGGGCGWSYVHINKHCLYGMNGKRHSAETKEKQRNTFNNINHQQGSKNSQYGTKWMHNKNLMQCKKVPKDAILDDGWEDGRIFNWDAYFSKVNKRIINENIRNEKVSELNNIDWDFTYGIYLLYGYEITCVLTGYDKTREALLAQFKKRVDVYTPSRSIKKIKSENIVR